MKRLSHTSTAACLILLAGCATSPEISAPPALELPSAWASSNTELGEPTAWLDDFNSPELEEIIDEALANNPTLQIAAARFDQALADAGIVQADQLPQLGVGLDGNRQQISTFGPTTSDGIIFENYNLSLNLSWELDLWGRLRDQSSAAYAQIEASGADLRAAQLSIVAQVTKAWFNYLAAQELVALAEKTAATYANNEQTLEERFQRGLSDGLNLRRIRTQASSARADLASRQRELDLAARSLEQLMGRYPSGDVDHRAELPEPPAVIPAGIPADLISRRPDLIAAERRLAASTKELSASEKLRLPQISLTGSSGTSSQEFKNLFDSDFSVWLLGANLTQPIFQGGRIKAGIRSSQAIKEQAEAQYLETAIQAFYEVEAALASESFLRAEQIELSQAAVEATASEALAWERFSRGTTEFIDALDTERTAAATRVQLINTRNRLLQNRIDLYLALGGPFHDES